MSDALTARQTQILKSLIDEYIETAEPVGSENLEKKYTMGVSPATIRTEMHALTDMGYLRQPHTSAGRVPSPKAMKFYIDQLMDERQMSLVDEVKVKEKVAEGRDDIDKILEEATRSLANTTRSLAVGAVNDEDKLWHSGFGNIFNNPEFEDFRATASLFSSLDEIKKMHELFFQRMTGNSPVEVIFGEELGWPGFNPIGVVGTRFELLGRNCALGVIGPVRLPYPRVIPIMRYFRGIFEGI